MALNHAFKFNIRGPDGRLTSDTVKWRIWESNPSPKPCKGSALSPEHPPNEGLEMIIQRNCSYCNSEYSAETRYLNRGQGQFCSQSCASKNRKSQPQPNTKCSYCEKDIYVKESRISRSSSGRVFCSKEHQVAGRAEGMYLSGPQKTKPEPVCPGCGSRYWGNRSYCPACLKAKKIEAWLQGDNEVTLGSGGDTKRFVKEYLLEVRGDSW